MLHLLVVAAVSSLQPSDEAQRLGRLLAEQGTLSSLLPMQAAKETDELVKDNADLGPTEQSRLRATAERVFEQGYDQVMRATGDAYARRLSVADLQALTDFYSLPVATRYRAATPAVIVEAMESIGKIDFKAEVRTAFCLNASEPCKIK